MLYRVAEKAMSKNQALKKKTPQAAAKTKKDSSSPSFLKIYNFILSVICPIAAIVKQANTQKLLYISEISLATHKNCLHQ